MSYMYVCIDREIMLFIGKPIGRSLMISIDAYLYTFSHHGGQTLPLWICKRKPDVCGNLSSLRAIPRD